MQHFWKWIVLQIPESWAPNAMTLAGLIVNVVTTAILMCYSPDGKQQVSLALRRVYGPGNRDWSRGIRSRQSTFHSSIDFKR